MTSPPQLFSTASAGPLGLVLYTAIVAWHPISWFRGQSSLAQAFRRGGP